MKHIDAEKLIAEIDDILSACTKQTHTGVYNTCHRIKGIITSLQQEQPEVQVIQWTGHNLKEVIDFTGKSPKFGEWFKSWEEFESYVHNHGDILKLFSEDGSHFEIPVGAWIVKTPDGYNVPSVARFIQAKQEQPEKSKKDCNVCPHCVDRKDQYGWHFKGCFGGPYNGKFIAEIEECPLKQEQPMPDSTKLIELWHEDKEMLKEKDFRDDPWRLAYNAFMCGFGRGIAIKKQEQPEVDIIPLPEGKMVSYINYCLQREDDECHCPTCGKYVTGLRLFPYYYDRENNDVYFASVCPECGKIIISKE